MVNDNFTGEYYERAWSQIASSISPQEEKRIQRTLSLIPEDCSSVLDVGCGDGRITNRLISHCTKVVGLEQSREGLRHVKVEKVLGSINSLPFPDHSFDLVLCCEVLEHIRFKVYPRAIEEMERVAGRYIIVTVPNDEDFRRALVTCPNCGCVFHPWRHLRSFRSKDMATLFNRFNLQHIETCRLARKVYPSFMVRAAKILKLIPTCNFPSNALCPQCGYSPPSGKTSLKSIESNKDSLLVRLLRPLARQLVLTKKRGGWLLALYKRI